MFTVDVFRHWLMHCHHPPPPPLTPPTPPPTADITLSLHILPTGAFWMNICAFLTEPEPPSARNLMFVLQGVSSKSGWVEVMGEGLQGCDSCQVAIRRRR